MDNREANAAEHYPANKTCRCAECCEKQFGKRKLRKPPKTKKVDVDKLLGKEQPWFGSLHGKG